MQCLIIWMTIVIDRNRWRRINSTFSGKQIFSLLWLTLLSEHRQIIVQIAQLDCFHLFLDFSCSSTHFKTESRSSQKATITEQLVRDQKPTGDFAMTIILSDWNLWVESDLLFCWRKFNGQSVGSFNLKQVVSYYRFQYPAKCLPQSGTNRLQRELSPLICANFWASCSTITTA